MNIHSKNNYKKVYKDIYTLLIITNYFMSDYNEMLKTAVFSIKTGLSDKENYYYAGLAWYHLKNYKQALIYFKNAEVNGYKNIETIYYMERCIDVINKRSLIKPLLPAGILKATIAFINNKINKVKIKFF